MLRWPERAGGPSLALALAPVSEDTFADWFGSQRSGALPRESRQELALSGFADRNRAKAGTGTKVAFLPLGPVSGEYHFS